MTIGPGGENNAPAMEFTMSDFLRSFLPSDCTLAEVRLMRCPDTGAVTHSGDIVDENGDTIGDVAYVDGGHPMVSWH